MIYANGDKYIGYWKNNKRHGQGRLVTEYEAVEGMWLEDRLAQNSSLVA
jgi:hypothetical protein